MNVLIEMNAAKTAVLEQHLSVFLYLRWLIIECHSSRSCTPVCSFGYEVVNNGMPHQQLHPNMTLWT